MKTQKVTGMVHIVENHNGSIYKLSDSGTMIVTVRQKSVWFEDFIECVDIRETEFETTCMNLRVNTCLPGNILEYITTEPPDMSDTEYGLWWEQDRVKRDYLNRPLYRLFRYDPDTKYKLYEETT